MKTIIKYFIILLWFILIGVLKLNNLIPLNVNLIKDFLLNQTLFAAVIFIGLWVVRLIALIPGVTLIVLGAVCFGPVIGFLLSLLGILLSESVVFFIAKTFLNKKINEFMDKKYSELKNLLQKDNYKLLALGIICPIAPTDVVCFLSASSGIKYSTYLCTVALANFPLMALYSSMGMNFGQSIYSVFLVIITIALCAILTINIWKKLKAKTDISE